MTTKAFFVLLPLPSWMGSIPILQWFHCHHHVNSLIWLHTTHSWHKTILKTRMHSSRMRTARSSSRVSTRHPPPPGSRTPWDQAPPRTRHPQDQAPPRDQAPPTLGADTPPGADTLLGAGTPRHQAPPCEQNDRQVQEYYLAPNFVCRR